MWSFSLLPSILDKRSANSRLDLLENAVLLVVKAIHVMFITSIDMFITSIEVMIGVMLYIIMLSVTSSDLLRHAGLGLNIQFRKNKFPGASSEFGMNSYAI